MLRGLALIFAVTLMGVPALAQTTVTVPVPGTPGSPIQSVPSSQPATGGSGASTEPHTDPVPPPPEDPKFDPNSGDTYQSYDKIYTRKASDAQPKVPRYTGTIGDFDRNVVNFNIQGKWYRLPRSSFGIDIRSGDKASIRIPAQQLKAYRIRP